MFINSIIDLQREADTYTKSLNVFLQKINNTSIFISAVDHSAIKASNLWEYENYVKFFVPLSTQITYTPMQGRKIAVAILKDSIDFGSLGKTPIVEIIEPKPEKKGTLFTGFEHIEIFHPELKEVSDQLKKNNIEFSYGKNDSHQSIIVVINDKEQEVKFTNRHLKDIIEEEKQGGKAILIK